MSHVPNRVDQLADHFIGRVDAAEVIEASVPDHAQDEYQPCTSAADLHNEQDAIALVEDVMLDQLRQIYDGENTRFLKVSRSTSNVLFVRSGAFFNVRLGHLHSTISFRRNRKRYTQIWVLLDTVHELLTTKRVATQRQLYYRLASHFESQDSLNATVQDLVFVLRCTRRSLNIVASARGLMLGNVEICENGRWVSCISSHSGRLICGDIRQVTAVRSTTIRAILIVEKDSVFNRLARDHLVNLFPCVMLTGKGMPGIATRAMVHRLYAELNVPVYGLFDYNPHGIMIMLSYAIGSVNMGLETFRFTVPVNWIGLRCADVAKLPPATHEPSHWEHRQELEQMLQRSIKLEIESLFSQGPNGLRDFVIQKLLRRGHA